jgi:uncharacterized protein (DUF362 family)
MAQAPLTRRRFVLAAGAALGALGSACGDDADSPAAEEPFADEVVPVPAGKAAVGLVGGDDVDAAVRRAIALAGGINEIQPGDTVFIKPNAVHGAVVGLPGIVTSAAVLGAVIRAVRRYKPGRVVVGDRPSRLFDSAFVFEHSGLREAALAAGADEVYEAPRPSADPSAWVLVQPPKFEETWAAQGGILAMRRILEADHFIDLPICKNHRWAAFSLSMKNLIGAIGDDSRDPMHYTEGDPDRLSRDIAILNQAFSPLISIVDARDSVINGGPEGVLSDRVLASPGLVLACRERVALDAAGAAILKHELARAEVPSPDELHALLTSTPVWSLPQIVHGVERGLGVSGADAVELRFEGVAAAVEIEAMFRA